MGQITIPTDEGTLIFDTQECGGCVFVHLNDPNSYRKILLPSWIDKANRNNGLVKLRHDLDRMGHACPAKHMAAVFRMLSSKAARRRFRIGRQRPKTGISVKRQKC